MPIVLSPELEMIQTWCDMKIIAEDLLMRLGYENYIVSIRTATEEEEGSLVSEDECYNVWFDKKNMTMEIIVGKGKYILAVDNIEYVEEFAQYSVVDMLDQFIEASEE